MTTTMGNKKVNIDEIPENQLPIPFPNVEAKSITQEFDDSWVPRLSFLNNGSITNVVNHIKDSKKIVYPDRENWFKVYKMPINKIKVVIIGQDPYPNVNASGLAFASNTSYAPPSLVEINKASGNTQLDLDNWVQQGVFLINSSLTVIANQPNSHEGIWYRLVQETIKIIDEHCKNVVFLLWGSEAQKFSINSSKHFVIKAEHPVMGARAKRAWRYNDCFNLTNVYLKDAGKDSIRWN